jgi:NhaP-type Na+/H+ or K+/H+ antiporter
MAILVAGLAFAGMYPATTRAEAVGRQEGAYEHVLKQVVQIPVFVLLGTALPWEVWADLGWRAPALVASILLLRRIPALLLLKPAVPQLRMWSEAVFVGWFGPIGVGALYFAAVAHMETHNTEVWAVATLLIAVTTVLHDFTATPFSQLLSKRVMRA